MWPAWWVPGSHGGEALVAWGMPSAEDAWLSLLACWLPGLFMWQGTLLPEADRQAAAEVGEDGQPKLELVVVYNST